MKKEDVLKAIADKIKALGSSTEPKEEPTEPEGEQVTPEMVAKMVEEAVAKNAPPVGAPTGGGNELTLETIKGMTAEQINNNWDKIKPLLESQPQQ